MNLFSALFPLSMGAFNLSAFSVLIPLAGIALAGVIIVCAMYFNHLQKQMLHETARLALEKGQTLSPELIESLSRSSTHRPGSAAHNDVRSGLILIAVGFGLYLFSPSVGTLRFVGAIPGLIGVALLLYVMVQSLVSRKKPTDDRGVRP